MTTRERTYRTVDAAGQPMRDMYFLMNSIVVPRPIAWVGTMGTDGTPNIAPHSYFVVAATDPVTVMFVSIGEKDTLRNAKAGACFTVNMVSHPFREQMNITAINAPYGVSEFELAGLETQPSDLIEAPRVLGAPVSLECELGEILEIGPVPAFNIYGRVVRLHVAEDLFEARGRVDPAKLDAIGRMGGAGYCTTRDYFELRRPFWGDPLEPGTVGNN
jgi:flavin reductase (DIM6/NTAB) family NADH-FMN oxidoreductase RutF